MVVRTVLLTANYSSRFGSEEHSWWVHLFGYRGRENLNQLIVYGEKLRKQMMKEYNIPNEKVHAIPIGEHEVTSFKIYERKDSKEDFILWQDIGEYNLTSSVV